MRSRRFTGAIANRKSGAERAWTVLLWAVIGVVGAGVVVPALIAIGTGAWVAKPDVQASEPAPEIESANANDRPSVGAVPGQTASHLSANPEPRGRFAESSEPGRLDSDAATRGGSGGSIPSPPAMPAPDPRSSALRWEPQTPVHAPSTFAPVAADEALAPSSAPETHAPAAAPETLATAPAPQPPSPPALPKGLNREQRRAWRLQMRAQVPYEAAAPSA